MEAYNSGDTLTAEPGKTKSWELVWIEAQAICWHRSYLLLGFIHE